MASVHRGFRSRLPSARVGDGLDWSGSRQGESLLDVVGLLLVFFLVTILNLPLVLQSSYLEVWLDAKEVYAFDRLWW